MHTANSPIRWNLNKLLDGFDFEKLQNRFRVLKEKLAELEINSKELVNENELLSLSEVIKQIESAESFYYCLTTENIDQTILSSLNTSISTLKSQVRKIISNIQDELRNINEDQFLNWSANIMNKRFLEELSIDTEVGSEGKAISRFTEETLSFLEDLYSQLLKNMKIKINLKNQENEIPFVKATHLAMSDPEPKHRNHIYNELNSTLKQQSNIFASIYNQMVGLRLKDYQLRNEDYLDKSLKLNGISKSSLDGMWNVIDSNLYFFSKYLKFKAQETTKEKLSWFELMTSSQEVSLKINFSQALEGIIKSLESIDSDIAIFVDDVVKKGWIDTEQRSTKPPGGFCAPFITEGESRITLTYDNSLDSARRLAHELGHAWHFGKMKSVPSLRFLDDTLEMTTAETSSIFFETVFIDYLIQTANGSSLKKEILGWKIERILNYLMSIRAAYLFENEFYEFRKKGPLETKLIEKISLQSQEKAYGNTLSEYEPYVWIKYVQFYQADIPFYNYPYSFGFLLSVGLLEVSKRDNKFSQKFQEFLSESGSISLERLIKKHFDIDLKESDFWQQSIQKLIQDIEEYVSL